MISNNGWNGSYMVKKSKRQTEVEGSGRELLPSVEGHNLGSRYKVRSN